MLYPLPVGLPVHTSLILTQVGDGVGVDVCWEGFLPLHFWVGNTAVLQSKALQLPRLARKLPVHLHGGLVQDLSEETGRTGNCGADSACGHSQRQHLQNV